MFMQYCDCLYDLGMVEGRGGFLMFLVAILCGSEGGGGCAEGLLFDKLSFADKGHVCLYF